MHIFFIPQETPCPLAVYSFTRAAITRYHRQGGLNHTHWFPRCSGGWKYKSQVPASLVSSEASSWSLQMAAFSRCPQRVFLPFQVSPCVLISSFYKDASQIRLPYQATCMHTQLCLTLCNAVDCSPPGSCVHGIFQARILEGVATSSSRGPSQPRDGAFISCHLLHRRWILYHWATWEAQIWLGPALMASFFHQWIKGSCFI